jgi:hypothetical protein
VACRLRRARRMNGPVIGALAGMKRSAMVLVAVGLFFGASEMVGQSTGGAIQRGRRIAILEGWRSTD